MIAGWVTSGQQNPQLGTIPKNAVVRSVYIHVTQAFNSDGTDLLTVGHAEDPDAYVTNLDVSTTGVKTVSLGTGVGWNGTARAVDVTYTASGSAPTTGKALVIVIFDLVPIQP